MHLVQILLPITDNSGKAFPEAVLQSIQSDICDRFGGLTAYTRAPAKGVWEKQDKKQHDDIIIIEVMVQNLENAWWKDFRHRLERDLEQEKIIIRAQEMELL